MKLPNSHLAVVDLRKLTEYCLNPRHEEGRHKARVFMSALGVGQMDATWLHDRILEAVATCEAQEQLVSPYGRRYIVDFVVVKEGRPASVRTAWIIKRDEVMPRLTSCFVL